MSVSGGALSRKIRDVSAECKKAKAFEVQRVVRRLKKAHKDMVAGKDLTEQEPAEGGGDSERAGEGSAKKGKQRVLSVAELERRLRLVRGVDYHAIALKIVESVDVAVPKKLLREWSSAAAGEASGEDSQAVAAENEAERDFAKGVEERIPRAKGVLAAVRRLEEEADQVRIREKRDKKKRKRPEDGAEATDPATPGDDGNRPAAKRQEKKLPCGIGSCGARFATTEARAAHWKKRHAAVFEDKVQSRGIDPTDPHAHLELATVAGKRNRTGQRERQRLALQKEKELARRESQAEAAAATSERKPAEKGAAVAAADARAGSKPAEKRARTEAAPSNTGGNVAEKTLGKASVAPAAQTRRAAAKPAQPEPESLHPSWEAKRRQKELAAKMNSAAFQGKRITFDSDSDSD